MKSFKIFFVAILASATAFAGELPRTVPAGVPGSPVLNPVQPVAQYNYNAGFSIRPGYEVLTINDDGSVVYESHYSDSTTGTPSDVTRTIAQLDPAAVAALTAKAQLIKESDLVDPEAGQPMCTDAPGSSISVYQSAGPVNVDSVHGCHHAKNETAEGLAIVTLMRGLVSLAQM